MYRLITSRLYLEPFTSNYVSEEYVGWLNDKELMRFSEQRHHMHTVLSCEAYLSAIDHCSSYLWAITMREGSGKHIGNISCHIDKNNDIADVGILLGERDMQGRGLAFEAWEACFYFLIHIVKVRKVTAGCMANNHAMMDIMKKSRMVLDGVRARHYQIDEGEVDIVHMALFSEGVDHLSEPVVERIIDSPTS